MTDILALYVTKMDQSNYFTALAFVIVFLWFLCIAMLIAHLAVKLYNATAYLRQQRHANRGAHNEFRRKTDPKPACPHVYALTGRDALAHERYWTCELCGNQKTQTMR